ncbi:hypothetical protein C8R44DRAFT_753495 [Mycena epipterygia]|nr:hypothetical protein C8R44DRAFT_753495 [Mycena epipterygia]
MYVKKGKALVGSEIKLPLEQVNGSDLNTYLADEFRIHYCSLRQSHICRLCDHSSVKRKNGPVQQDANSTRQAHEKIEAQKQLQKDYNDGEEVSLPSYCSTTGLTAVSAYLPRVLPPVLLKPESTGVDRRSFNALYHVTVGADSSSLWLASAACLLLATCAAWQKFCKSSPPWIAHLHLLGQPRKHKLKGTAIICGGSIAGIVTARICANHFERVIVVDPEIQYSEKPKTRIMQYNSAHIYLSLFIDGARRFWPNFDNKIKAAGDRLMMDHPTSSNISLMPGTVCGVHPPDDGASIQSVVVRQPDGKLKTLHDVEMVADCTGMTQAGFKWLRAAGFSLPDDLCCSYSGNLRYVALCFTVPPELAAKLPIPERLRKTMLVYSYSPHLDALSSFLALMITDNDTMQLIIGDTANADLPRSAPEVVPFICGFQGLKAPVPAWVIQTMTILCRSGNPSFDSIRLATQSYVRYHCAAGALPANFVAIGDSRVHLNPIHGQGFAKAIMDGMILNSLLHAVAVLQLMVLIRVAPKTKALT